MATPRHDLRPGSAERGAVLLFDRTGEFSSAVAWDRVLGPGHPVRVSRTVVQRVRGIALEWL